MPIWSMAGLSRSAALTAGCCWGAAYATTSARGQPLHPIYALGAPLTDEIAFKMLGQCSDKDEKLLWTGEDDGSLGNVGLGSAAEKQDMKHANVCTKAEST